MFAAFNGFANPMDFVMPKAPRIAYAVTDDCLGAFMELCRRFGFKKFDNFDRCELDGQSVWMIEINMSDDSRRGFDLLVTDPGHAMARVFDLNSTEKEEEDK